MSDVQGFFAAIRGGDVAKVQAMLTEDPPLAESKNEQKQSPVLAAVYGGQSAVRDLLIAHGAHLELHEAVAAGKGVVLVDGRLVENLHVEEAMRIVALTEAIEAQRPAR